MGLEEIDAGAFGAEVGFETDEHEGCVGAEMEDFGVPLRLRVSMENWVDLRQEKVAETYLVHYILQRVRAVNSEADEEEVGFRVGEWTQTVILFLPRSVPKS